MIWLAQQQSAVNSVVSVKADSASFILSERKLSNGLAIKVYGLNIHLTSFITD